MAPSSQPETVNCQLQAASSPALIADLRRLGCTGAERLQLRLGLCEQREHSSKVMIKLSPRQGHGLSREGEPYSHLGQAAVARTGLGRQGPGVQGPRASSHSLLPAQGCSGASQGRRLCCPPCWDFVLTPSTMKLQVFWTGLEYTCRLLGITTAAGKTPPPGCQSLHTGTADRAA